MTKISIQCASCLARVARFEVKQNVADLFPLPTVILDSFKVQGTTHQCVVAANGMYNFRCLNPKCDWHRQIPVVYFNQVLGQASIDGIPVLEIIPVEIESLHQTYQLGLAAYGLKRGVLPPERFSREDVLKVFLQNYRHEVAQPGKRGERPGTRSRYHGFPMRPDVTLLDPFGADLEREFEQWWHEAERRRPSV